MKTLLELFIVFLIALGILFAFGMRAEAPVSVREFFAPHVPVEPFTYVAVGDVMLGRNVRHLMRTRGDDYPFAYTAPIFENADAVVINLEGPITELDAPDERVGPDQPYSMRFAFDVLSADVLARAGVTHASLANNHAWDQGTQGNKDTRQQLERVGISYFGAPWGLSVGTVAHIRKDGHDIAFLGLDDTIAPLNIEKLSREITSFGTSTHIVAFIHWGDEYELVHNTNQERIAHALIDAGVDAIIGSHPHVVQDIEVYKGAPIFYSLGNFIFDQYWNDDVESGLALRITHDEFGEQYELIPIDGNHSQPKLMEEPARQAFLDALAERSQTELGTMIRNGALWLE